ncbi:MAG: asparagine synthase (glutamine-hydrolyzing) [Deltaproteobacteria bacterium]|nr:asparagine synthase (glutamine-hydrolyzing) [Deltaproteobacteria bacterium]
MCGIVGFKTPLNALSLQGALREAVSRLSHRGPDDSGFFLDPKDGVGMGHSRLSIIDLSPLGRQPMGNDDGKVQIVFNGEVYNFREIRKSLEELGHSFHSSTDTEVILKAYLQWGIECLQRFVGMFALAVWDSRNQLLFLARDRLGKKPLYYYFSSGNLLFASELKALIPFRLFEKHLDPDAISLYFHYLYVPAPKTIFKNTFKLLPGHYAVFNDQNIQTHCYWELPPGDINSKISDQSEDDTIEEMDHILTQAVSDRLVSDVPLGALLSGGIDSSAVVALMQKVNTSPVRTFNIGFHEPAYNEAPWASKVAKYLGTDHTELYVTPAETIEIIPKLPEIYDEPFADSSAIPTFLVSRLARSQVTVALSGDGGDEQFAGYDRYWKTRVRATRFAHIPTSLRKALAIILGSMPAHWVEKCHLPWRHFVPRRFREDTFTNRWQTLINLISETGIQELYRMAICPWSADRIHFLLGRIVPQGQFEETFLKTKELSPLSRLMRVDLITYLPDDILTKVDRASMATSLEVRAPLLDHRVVEYTSRLPDSFKYKNGSGKYLLKKLLTRYLPSELFERPKMGFSAPIDQWFRVELKELLFDYLSPARLSSEGLFDHIFVDKMISEHLSGRADHKHRLWSLLMWEMWRDRWL